MLVDKARGDEKLAQLIIPSSKSLFETIYSFAKLADMMRMILIKKKKIPVAEPYIHPQCDYPRKRHCSHQVAEVTNHE